MKTDKLRIGKIEAKYAAYKWAHSWVSEAAEPHYDSDFYNELYKSQLLDESKLDETNGFDNEITLFIPNDLEIKIIKNEMVKLSNKLFKELMNCKKRYYETQK